MDGFFLQRAAAKQSSRGPLIDFSDVTSSQSGIQASRDCPELRDIYYEVFPEARPVQHSAQEEPDRPDEADPSPDNH